MNILKTLEKWLNYKFRFKQLEYLGKGYKNESQIMLVA